MKKHNSQHQNSTFNYGGNQRAGCMSDSKRFYTEQEIIAEIDQSHALAKRHMINAETYEMEIKALQLRGNPTEEWMIEEKAKMAKHERKLTTALLDVR